MQSNKAEFFDDGLLFFNKLSQNRTNCFMWPHGVIFLTAIWLNDGQLWAIIEGAASLTRC